jgi:ATPase subunit of ABC transporter with duplicated ATPase domains
MLPGTFNQTKGSALLVITVPVNRHYLNCFVGEYQPSEGTVEKGRETTIGYLHQDLLSFESNDSILTVAMGAFEKVLALEKGNRRTRCTT